MTPEEKSLLERTYKLTEENNEMLRSIRRSARVATAMRIVYWVIIIGASVGAYYLIQPYVDFMLNMLNGDGGSNTQSAMSSLQDLLR